MNAAIRSGQVSEATRGIGLTAISLQDLGIVKVGHDRRKERSSRPPGLCGRGWDD